MYISVTAGDYPAASRMGRRFAFVAYQIGENSALLRRNLPIQTQGGLLSAGDRDAPVIENPEALCAAFLRECGRRGYSGAVLDFEEPRTEDRAAFVALLSRRLRETGRSVYVPEVYGNDAPGAALLVCTAISGGNYREYLEEAIQRRGGAERIALDVQRLRMDFQLPAPDGMGKPLTEEEFASRREGKTVFFSPDLCARYFTETRHIPARDGSAQSGEAHFILFDDADTITRKLDTAASLGIGTAFLQWPEIADIAAELKLGERERR